MLQNDRSRRITKLSWIKLIFFILILSTLTIAVFAIDNLLVSLVVATVMSFLAAPLISHMESRGITRLTAILIVFSLFSATSTLLIMSLTPRLLAQFDSLKAKIPSYIDGTTKLLDQLDNWVQTAFGQTAQLDITAQATTWMLQSSNSILENAPAFVSSSLAVLLLSPILGFFILKDGRKLSRDLLRLVPNEYFELILNLQAQINLQIGQFIRARMLEAFIVGLVVLVGLWAIGFPYAILLALFAALTNLIPYIGPIVGVVPPLAILAINHESTLMFVMVLLVYVIAQLIDMFLIIPLVVARIVNLHPVTVILVVIIGAQVLGILGMIISIPVASACKVTFTSIYRHLTDYTT